MILDRTYSHLLKAQQIESCINDNELPSVQITLAQDAAEHAFRAILYGMSISRIGTHRLDTIARKNQDQLKDIWLWLEPFLDEYAWLWEFRNIARYSHVDSPSYSEPPIDKDMVERAIQIAKGLLLLAKRMV